jgi:hypothetical protein
MPQPDIMPYFECTHFDSCSVNACPLDPLYDARQNTPGDDKKCIAKRAYRSKIAANFLEILPHGGLTLHEERVARATQIRNDKMTPEQREERRKILQERIKKARAANPKLQKEVVA